MAGTLHTKEYKRLIEALVAERSSQGLSQAELAKTLKRPPSFVAKVELCERRLDVLEYCAWAYALSVDPLDQLRLFASLPLATLNVFWRRHRVLKFGIFQSKPASRNKLSTKPVVWRRGMPNSTFIVRQTWIAASLNSR